MYRILVFGPQGSGKNTQAELLAKKLGLPMISAGDLWREEIAAKTELGIKAEPILALGKLAPDEWTIELIKKRITQADTANGFILNGYPRTIAQAKALDAIAQPTRVINLVLSDEDAIARLGGRQVCKQAGHNYHIKYNSSKQAGVCDIDGSALLTRDDDKPKAVRTRLAWHHEQTEPILEIYRPRGIVYDIDAAGAIEQVASEISKTFIHRNMV